MCVVDMTVNDTLLIPYIRVIVFSDKDFVISAR